MATLVCLVVAYPPTARATTEAKAAPSATTVSQSWMW